MHPPAVVAENRRIHGQNDDFRKNGNSSIFGLAIVNSRVILSFVLKTTNQRGESCWFSELVFRAGFLLPSRAFDCDPGRPPGGSRVVLGASRSTISGMTSRETHCYRSMPCGLPGDETLIWSGGVGRPRRAHNPEIAGSNPASSTRARCPTRWAMVATRQAPRPCPTRFQPGCATTGQGSYSHIF